MFARADKRTHDLLMVEQKKKYCIFFQTYAAGGPGMFLDGSLFFDPKAAKHPQLSFRVNHGLLRCLLFFTVNKPK